MLLPVFKPCFILFGFFSSYISAVVVCLFINKQIRTKKYTNTMRASNHSTTIYVHHCTQHFLFIFCYFIFCYSAPILFLFRIFMACCRLPISFAKVDHAVSQTRYDIARVHSYSLYIFLVVIIIFFLLSIFGFPPENKNK